ncbi:Flagellar hook-associated protein 2 [Planctomycetes bacterium Pan216]|uniref:Filament cap protein n=1 Tax=Kolteria novifilia TaxID=2527975 RepID=A0A518B367_9BACT|nr:Flagellar hook-associated protein 2 [Planctomycetes bacterium Pan216]
MGTIQSSIGPFSGIDIGTLVEQLIELEARPAQLIQQDVDANTEVVGLLQNFSLNLVSSRLSVAQLGIGGVFGERNTTTSSPAITASAGKNAPIGAFSFSPVQLVTTDQFLSTGVSSPEASIANADTTLSISLGGFIDAPTDLNLLNGGNGVGLGSVRVTDRSGASEVIDLSGSVTSEDILNRINAAQNINVTASTEGGAFVLTDNTGLTTTQLSVSDVGSGSVAADLGLDGAAVGNTLTGSDVFVLSEDTNLRFLNDGNGITSAAGADFTIDDGENVVSVDLLGLETIGDVVDAINDQGTTITASLSDNGIVLNSTAAAPAFSITAQNGSLAAFELGLSGFGVDNSDPAVVNGRNVLGGLGSPLLTSLGGGYQGGTDTQLTTGAGSTFQVGVTLTSGGPTTVLDLGATETTQEFIDSFNTAADGAALGVSIRANDVGNGFVVERSGGGYLELSDENGGNLLDTVGLASISSSGSISADAELQHISETTRLDTLNAGEGVRKGRFVLSDANGQAATIDLRQSDDDTIQDVIEEINATSLAITARINDTGDGILLVNEVGTGSISVTDLDGGRTAQDLRLTGSPIATGEPLEGSIDGSFEYKIDVSAGDSLEDLQDKLREAGAPVFSTIIDDGSAINPFRFSLTSRQSGLAGRLLIDPGATSLDFTNVSRGQDAIVLLGGGNANSSQSQITSSSNTFSDLIPGLDITLNQVSTSPVTVSINQNTDSILEAVQGFVDNYNELRTFIDDNASFDTTSNESGLLFSESSIRSSERRLVNFANQLFTNTGSDVRTLGDVGITLDRSGQLQFDRLKFRSVLNSDPEGVQDFFGASGTGVSDQFESLVDGLNDTDGLISNRVDNITRTIERQNKAIEEIGERLEIRQERLLLEFVAMERAIATLTSQQNALSQLSGLASSVQAAARG